MMTNTAIVPSSTNPLLIAGDVNKDQASRLALFDDWLRQTGSQWERPDLAAYRDYLLGSERTILDRKTGQRRSVAALSPQAANSHLATIRARYQSILSDNATRDYLYQMTPGDVTGADRKAFVDEAITRLQNAVNPRNSSVKVATHQDRADSTQLRLTFEQGNALMAAPGIDSLGGLRNTALIALALCSGLREGELAALDITDLRQAMHGELCLHVRRGKGAKERLVPYGDDAWCLDYLDRWLEKAGITEGAVFRSFWKGGRVRDARLTTRAIQDIVAAYPVMIAGRLREVRPHDLRRTYARRCYDKGMPPVVIQQNLGHADINTTLEYIGKLDVRQRRPPKLFEPPHLAELHGIAVHQTMLLDTDTPPATPPQEKAPVIPEPSAGALATISPIGWKTLKTVAAGEKDIPDIHPATRKVLEEKQLIGYVEYMTEHSRIPFTKMVLTPKGEVWLKAHSRDAWRPQHEPQTSAAPVAPITGVKDLQQRLETLAVEYERKWGHAWAWAGAQARRVVDDYYADLPNGISEHLGNGKEAAAALTAWLVTGRDNAAARRSR